MVTACEIVGSADASIKNPVVADLNEIFSMAKIERVLLNGATAYDLFKKNYGDIQIPYFKMPSTSPANPRFDERVWREKLDDLR